MTTTRTGLGRVLAAVWVAGLCGCGKPQVRALEPGAVVVAFGDSLTSGFGAEEEEGYPAVLAKLTGCKVVNEGVPGEVSEEGLGRLPSVLRKYNPEWVIICHGGNDLLQRADEGAVAARVQAMVEAAQAAGAEVILIGVPRPGLFLKAAPFYQEIAWRNGILYDGKVIPKILSKQALKSDAIHPNAEGYRLLAQRLSELIRGDG